MVVGCGFLGSCIVKNLSELTDGEHIIATVRNKKNAPHIEGVEFVECDVNNIDDLESLKSECGTETVDAVYLSAVHNIDYVFQNPAEAAETNICALRNFFDIFNNIGHIIYTSTDCVYGDKPYLHFFKENDDLCPVNEYGKQKMLAEKTVLEYGGKIVRLPLMLGPTHSPKKGFFDNCKEKLLNGIEIEMLEGYLRSALTFKDAAEYIVRLLTMNDDIPPIVNVCSDEVLSKYDIGCRLADYINCPRSLVKAIPKTEGAKFYKETRAESALMDNSLLKSILGIDKILFRF